MLTRTQYTFDAIELVISRNHLGNRLRFITMSDRTSIDEFSNIINKN